MIINDYHVIVFPLLRICLVAMAETSHLWHGHPNASMFRSVAALGFFQGSAGSAEPWILQELSALPFRADEKYMTNGYKMLLKYT